MTHSLTSSVHFFGGLSANVRSLVAQNLMPFNVSKGVELCREGEAARCCWVMESGSMLACNMKGDVHKLHAPCLFGESLFLGQELFKGCESKCCTIRALLVQASALELCKAVDENQGHYVLYACAKYLAKSGTALAPAQEQKQVAQMG
ncbi:hypothetical protein DUNSADRAFT_12282 [Dunaliella salina]|uniref:Cyclic nucleotide-binding domain-containing protein n=1 Tax=Dunaliella salina TaxID=3046 RepID=A0ABQ7H401_DUNSA|nr:hypothetical protein DUNSADRAFT_12282 [Dunaliella salina]|eukprot:KAF5841584.1 hypothetical protein DUNSADRAFT_12282 [Dunaliella salina]